MTNKKRMLLIDGDQLVYNITSAAEEEVTFSSSMVEHDDAWVYEGQQCLFSDAEECIRACDLKACVMASEGNYDLAIIAFTSTPNFRHDCLPTYKGGRIKKRKPLAYWNVVNYFIDHKEWNTKKIPGLEADDVMSIYATNPKYLREYTIDVWSVDKDMLQIPDTTILKPDGSTMRYSMEEANHWRYTQCLVGDRTDGYTGLKGWGPVKAVKYLDSVRDDDESVYIDHVVSAYLDAGISFEDAYAQMNCARILRHSEYDFKKRKPILLGG